jgi:hypothetical protein
MDFGEECEVKKIFYYTDFLPILFHGEKALEKLKRNLQIFRDAAEKVQLVWHPYSKNIEYLEKNNSPFTEEYSEIVNTFRSDSWGVLDETATYADAKEVLFTCDAYYGDCCNLAFDANVKGLPVMFQNVEV